MFRSKHASTYILYTGFSERAFGGSEEHSWADLDSRRSPVLSDSELNAIFAPKQSNIPKRTPQRSKHRSTIDPPDYLDWSKTRPECINNIRDMKNCGTSQTFSTISVLSDQRCIQHNDTAHVQYSEQFVINCNENGPDVSTWSTAVSQIIFWSSEQFQIRVLGTNLARTGARSNARVLATTELHSQYQPKLEDMMRYPGSGPTTNPFLRWRRRW
ncbi:Cathepsin_B [Hexamita inflata]|uniref:Cathepsin B n=1 Tax=Hexamita inflata TaxID=28002 RepID=A0AA86TBH3_9EUKA|nr:Cathepsin B [Hexamita inflata]